MRKQIIIGRKLHKPEIDKLLRADADFIFLDDSNLRLSGKKIELSPDDKKEINYSVLDEILKFGDKKIDGNPVSKLLQVEKCSIWHYHKFRTYFFIRNIAYELRKLEKVIRSAKVTDFYCGTEFRFLAEELHTLNLIFPPKNKQKIKYLRLIKYLLFVIRRTLINFFVSTKNTETFILTQERYSPVLGLSGSKREKGNFLFEYLFEKANNKYSILSEVQVPKIKGNIRFQIDREFYKNQHLGLGKINLEGVFFRHGIIGFLRAKNAAKKITESYSVICNADLSLHEKIAARFIHSLHSSTTFYLGRYFAAKAFFRKKQFKTILATDENSPLNKSVLDAANFYGIKTIGMQHGTMHDLHPAYLYTKEDIQNNVLPDYTLVWGECWKSFLVEKGNYPESSVVQVGHLRTDIIPQLLKQKATKNKKFTLVFASQPQRDAALRKQAALDVFKATKNLENVELIVKLHPREYNDVNYYRAIAIQAGSNNLSFDKKTDLYELIASCDALITCFSTVGTETVYFNKPLIILDHLKQDIQGYCKEGVAFQVTNSEELQQTILKIKDGNLVINQEAYSNFVNKYAHKIDGNVAERILNFIDSLE